LLARDPSDNGHFFVGVPATGIYCVPSCQVSKPKLQQVKFFPTVAAARDDGLKACKRCRPDDFSHGAEHVLESTEVLVADIRAHPFAFSDVRAIVRRSGFSGPRVAELFQQHYHTTPADLLLRARLAAAKRELVSSDTKVSAAAARVGFPAGAAFATQFQKFNGLTPDAFRTLTNHPSFKLMLPEGYPLGYLRRALSRDVHSVTETLKGDLYTTVAHLSSGPAILRLRLSETAVSVDVDFLKVALAPSLMIEAHAIVVGLLGLEQDATAFVRLVQRLRLARLTAGRPELRISQTPSVFEGVLWSIIGQQINFAFACLLRRRLVERAGTPVGDGLYAPPTPHAVAQLEPADLLPLQFSRQKADYVLATSRLIADGKLDLEALRTMSATRAERTLLAIRGLGPWSVNYIMMRSLGFSDCVPLGDTGVTSGLLALLKLDERPDVSATKRLMAPFSPFRSLATTHLWQFNRPLP
jgi:AraC family transcriptional regulator of adaptative response / DNA-3-methyladenine glycosylase II